MNAVWLTGYLPADPITRVTPLTHAQKLCFDVITRDSSGNDVMRACFLDVPEMIQKFEPVLDRGRAVVVHGENVDRPVVEAGRVKFIAREIRVQQLEVPNRTGAKPTEENDKKEQK